MTVFASSSSRVFVCRIVLGRSWRISKLIRVKAYRGAVVLGEWTAVQGLAGDLSE